MSRLGERYQRYSKFPSSTFAESNAEEFQMNSYKTNHTDPHISLSSTSEPNIEYEKRTSFLTISSRDRDASLYPSVSKYMITFPMEIKNVESVELIQAILPDKNNVTSEPYLLLKIDEMEDVMISNDRNVSDAFAILQLSSPVTPGGFIQMDRKIHENVIKYYKTPKASLSKMTISVTDYAGNLFNFGTDNTNSPEKALQNTFVFRIESLEKKRSALNHRNVF
jgi:hypothetical protein